MPVSVMQWCVMAHVKHCMRGMKGVVYFDSSTGCSLVFELYTASAVVPDGCECTIATSATMKRTILHTSSKQNIKEQGHACVDLLGLCAQNCGVWGSSSEGIVQILLSTFGYWCGGVVTNYLEEGSICSNPGQANK